LRSLIFISPPQGGVPSAPSRPGAPTFYPTRGSNQRSLVRNRPLSAPSQCASARDRPGSSSRVAIDDAFAAARGEPRRATACCCRHGQSDTASCFISPTLAAGRYLVWVVGELPHCVTVRLRRDGPRELRDETKQKSKSALLEVALFSPPSSAISRSRPVAG
jgi:hypothetical protein